LVSALVLVMVCALANDYRKCGNSTVATATTISGGAAAGDGQIGRDGREV
jgi:hypothetical protein